MADTAPLAEGHHVDLPSPDTLPLRAGFQPHLPSEHHGHSLLCSGDYYFTLPIELLEAVVSAVGEERFDPDLLALDRSLSRANGDHSVRVGFHRQAAVGYDLLAQPASLKSLLNDLTPEMKAALGWDNGPDRQGFTVNALDGRLTWMREICQGYCGWLSLNPTFVQEQDRFFSDWRDAIARDGVAAKATAAAAADPLFIAARDALLARWQLTAVAGPFLPSPVRPQVPVISASLVPKSADTGTLIFFPSIFPMPDREVLKQMIEDAMGRHRAPDHLRGWIAIVEGDNPGKKSLSRLGRVFVLQHFWRALFARHEQALKNQIESVRWAFAGYLFPDADEKVQSAKVASIQKALNDISRVRGLDWYRPSRLGAGI